MITTRNAATVDGRREMDFGGKRTATMRQAPCSAARRQRAPQ
jgi:hypothetical protein